MELYTSQFATTLEKKQGIYRKYLEGIKAQAPVLPDGSRRRLKLRLAQRSEMKLSIDPSS